VDRPDQVSHKYSLLINVDKTVDGIVCRRLIQNEQLEQLDMFPYVPWVHDCRRCWVYDAILYQVKQRGRRSGITV